MNERLLELASRFQAWLSDSTASASLVASELLALPPVQWRAFTDVYPNADRATIAEAVLQRAVVLQKRAPKESAPVCRLAVKFAKAYIGPTADEKNRGILLEADGCRELAWSLMQTGDFEDAKSAAEEAAFYYSLLVNDSIPDDDTGNPFTLQGDVLSHFLAVIRDHYRDDRHADPLTSQKRAAMENATRLGVMLGEILHNLGNTDEGLWLIERSCEVLLYFLDRKDRYVKARAIYAKILGEAQRWSEALKVFEATSSLAMDTGDEEVQAFLLGNIGTCYYFLGDPVKAKEYAETAMQMFEELGSHLDAIRPRTLLVLLLMEEGARNRAKYNAAAAELFKSRAAWLEAGMKNEAARVMVRIIRAFIMAGRPEAINWPETIRTFTDAGLGDAAMSVLLYLEGIAAVRALRPGDVDAAEDMLSHLSPSGDAFEEAG